MFFVASENQALKTVVLLSHTIYDNQLKITSQKYNLNLVTEVE